MGPTTPLSPRTHGSRCSGVTTPAAGEATAAGRSKRSTTPAAIAAALTASLAAGDASPAARGPGGEAPDQRPRAGRLGGDGAGGGGASPTPTSLSEYRRRLTDRRGGKGGGRGGAGGNGARLAATPDWPPPLRFRYGGL